MVANILLAAPTPPPLPQGSKCQVQLLQDNVMLHIKFIGMTKCSNMVVNILPADPHLLTLGVKNQLYSFVDAWRF